MKWDYKILLKDLFTEKEDHESIQKSMTAIADRIKLAPCFATFNTTDFYVIPKGDNFFKPVEYANKLIERMYDFADGNRIWIQ